MAARPLNSPWGHDSSDDDADDSRLLDGNKRDYQSTQEQYLREHEEGLNKLGQAIKRQKHMASELATEVDVHNEIIDDIDGGLTRTADNLRKNTRNIQLVIKKSSAFFLWLLIVILALIIVALALI